MEIHNLPQKAVTFQSFTHVQRGYNLLFFLDEVLHLIVKYVNDSTRLEALNTYGLYISY